MPFSLDQEEFQGPLALLLSLIQERKLEITRISLTKVADAFLEAIKARNLSEEEMADALVIAARLIYLKTKELLPYLALPEEDHEVDRLQDTLRAYEQFVAAAKRLQAQWGTAVSYQRTQPRVRSRENFLPHPSLRPEVLHESFLRVLKRLAPFFALRQQRVRKTLSLEERLQGLRDALRARGKMAFREVIAQTPDREDVVVQFLALLEMWKQKEVHVLQEASFGDIILERVV